MLVPDKFLLFRLLCYAKLAHMFSTSSGREPLFAKRLLIFSIFLFLNIFLRYVFYSNDRELCNGTSSYLGERKRERKRLPKRVIPSKKIVSLFYEFVVG